MPRSAALATYADFTATCDAAAVVAVLDAAPNREALRAVYQELTGTRVPPTAFYNLSRSLAAIRDGKSFVAGGREYGNPTGESDHSKLSVPMQGGLDFAGINSLAAAFAERGKEMFPKSENGNGNGNGERKENAAPAAAAPSTPVTTGSGPMPVAPELIDTVKSLQERFAAEDADAPRTGRAFLETLWEATPEEERNRRVNNIARAFVEARESASRRGELRTMIDNLSRALKDDGAVAPDLDIWTFIYNRALPDAAQSESYDQIKTNLQSAYRFDPNAAMFRDWESYIAAQAETFVRLFGKGMKLTPEMAAASIARDRTNEALDSILSGMLTAQKRFEEWETRSLREATPPQPPVAAVPFDALSPVVQGMIPEEVWTSVLTPDQQRQWFASRSISEVDGKWVTADEARAAADAAHPNQ
jgi:hypothetical protein